jgi:hypothetical protein
LGVFKCPKCRRYLLPAFVLNSDLHLLLLSH